MPVMFFHSLHIPLYFMFSMVVYSQKGSIFLHVLVKNEDMLIRDFSFRLSVLMFQNSFTNCILEYSSGEYIMFTFTSHCTLTTGQTGSL